MDNYYFTEDNIKGLNDKLLEWGTLLELGDWGVLVKAADQDFPKTGLAHICVNFGRKAITVKYPKWEPSLSYTESYPDGGILDCLAIHELLHVHFDHLWNFLDSIEMTDKQRELYKNLIEDTIETMARIIYKVKEKKND